MPLGGVTVRTYYVNGDPVKATDVWIANCDACGGHTPTPEPKEVVREWARVHRSTCPAKNGAS